MTSIRLVEHDPAWAAEFEAEAARVRAAPGASVVALHQLHAFAVGSGDIDRHVDFRDYLRAHPAEARAYAELKLVLAGPSANSRAYTEGKTDYIRDIERRATDWRHQSP